MKSCKVLVQGQILLPRSLVSPLHWGRQWKCFGCYRVHISQRRGNPISCRPGFWDLPRRSGEGTCDLWLLVWATHGDDVFAVNYTMFSAPGSGPCGSPWSWLLCSCASCRTGMLHRGQTFRTSSHLMRHFLWKACLHGHIPSSSLGLNSSRQTAQICKEMKGEFH